MEAVDLIIIGIVLISCLIGVFRGLVKEALSLVTWFVAIFIAGLFGEQMADVLSGVINNTALRRVVGFALLFVATVFIGGLIGNLISKMTSAVGLRTADRVLGALFGLIRATVIIVLIVMLTAPFEFSQQWYQQSLAVPYIMLLAEYLQGVFGLVEDGISNPLV